MRDNTHQNDYEDGLIELACDNLEDAAYCFIPPATCGHQEALNELAKLSSTLNASAKLQHYLLVEILYHIPRLQTKHEHFARLSQLIRVPETLVPAVVMQAADNNQQTYEISCALLRATEQIADHEERKRTEQAALRGLISTLFHGFYSAFQFLNTPQIQSMLPINGTTRNYYNHGMNCFNQLQQQLEFQVAYREAEDPLARLALELANRSPSPSLTESSIPEEPEQEELAASNNTFIQRLPESLQKAFRPYNG